MYKIKYVHRGSSTENVLYESGNDEKCLSSAKLKLGMGSTGELTIKVPVTNPARDLIQCPTDEVVVYRDDTEIFRGRPVTDEQDFNLTGTLTCEGILAYLYDTYYEPFEFQGTPVALLTAVINHHNSQVEARKQFRVGNVTVVDKNNYINRSSEGYNRTLDILSEKFVKESLGGFFRARIEGGVRYIDYLSSYGTTATQEVRFGSNILDVAKTIEYSDFITAVLPLGKKNDETKKYLTVASVNGGEVVVQDSELVNNHGFICEKVEWEDVTEPTNLLRKAQDYLAQASVAITSMKIKALDLALADPNVQSLNVGDAVHVISEPHHINQWIELSEITMDLLNPANDSLVFGAVSTSITKKTSSSGKTIKENINDLTMNVHKISADYVTASYLTANYLTANQIEANYTKTKELDAKYLKADMANIDHAKIDKAQIGTLLNEVGLISEATITDGHVTGQLSSVTIDAGSIKTGTLDASNITVSNLNADSITTGTLNGQLIGQGTVDLSVLNSASASRIDGLEDDLEQAQSDIQTAKSDISTAKSDIAKAKTDISTAKTDIAKAKTDIAKAKTDISTAQSDIQTAQSDIQTAKSDIATAQSDINTAKSDIATAKSDIAKAKTDIVDAMNEATSAKNTASTAVADATSALAKATQTDNDLKALDIGGRNLLRHTKDFAESTYSSTCTFAKDVEGVTVVTFPAYTGSVTWKGCTFHPNIPYSMIRNKTVTLSFWYRSDSWTLASGGNNVPLPSFEILATPTANPSGTNRLKYITIYDSTVPAPTTEWQQFVRTYNITDSFFTNGSGTVTEDRYFTIQLFQHNLSQLQCKKFKLEIGNKATDWTPAPEDVDGAIDQKLDTERYDDEFVAENLIPFPYSAEASGSYKKSVLSNGITITQNDDGSVSIVGTPTAINDTPLFRLAYGDYNQILLENKIYIFNPNFDVIKSGISIQVACRRLNGTYKALYVQNSTIIDNSDGEFFKIDFSVWESSNLTTAINLKFYPMFEVGSVSHEYQPYIKSRNGIVNVLDTWSYDADHVWIDGGNIYANTVVSNAIASNAVTADKIASNAVTADKILAGSVIADKIASNAITSAKIASNAVIADKIASNAVTADKINASAVTADKIASNAVTAEKIVSSAITTDKLNANAVTTAKIASGAITADTIASNAITTEKINASAITSAKIASNAVIADKIASNAVTADKINASAVTADKIASNAVTAEKIVSSAITTDKLNANAVTTAKIASGAITADTIASNAITTEKILAGSITADKLTIADFANLCNVNEKDPNSVNTRGSQSCRIVDGWLCKNKESQTYTALSNRNFHNLQAGDKIYCHMIVKGTSGNDGIIRMKLYGFDDETSSSVADANGENITITATEQVYTCVITVTEAIANAKYISVHVVDVRSTKSQIYFKNVFAYKQNGTTLIQDGAITTDKIVTNAITADKIASGSVVADKIASNAITAGKIATNAVTAEKINVGDLSAIGATIGGFTITSADLHCYTEVDTSGNNTSDQTAYITKLWKGTANPTDYALSVQKCIYTHGTGTHDFETTFRVRYDGSLYCTNADIKGKVTATSGNIGGFNVSTDNLSCASSTTANTRYLAKIRKYAGHSTDLAFDVGHTSDGGKTWDFPFYVRYNGALHASNANITGGSLNINNNFIVNSSGNTTCNDLTANKIYSSGNVSFYATDTTNGGIYSNANIYGVGTVSGKGGMWCGAGLYVVDNVSANSCISRSDRRLKEDIIDLPTDDAVHLLNDVEPKYYKLTADPSTERMGFIAQDIQEVLKKNNLDESLLVVKTKDPESQKEWLNLNYSDFIAVLVKGWQEHEAKIKELEDRIKVLESRWTE